MWRELALRLVTVALEQDNVAGGLRVLRRMDAVLARLAGQTGSRTLIARAVVLSQEDAPWLMTDRVPMERVMDHLEECFGRATPDEQFRAEATVLAHVFILLDTFIGERLTLQLIREAWPGPDFPHLEFPKDNRP